VGDVYAGKDRRVAYQAMAKWVADNPSYPGRAFRDWITWMHKQNALVHGRIRLRDHRVDLTRIEQNLLVVTGRRRHIAPREGRRRCSTSSAARTSRTSNAPAGTSG